MARNITAPEIREVLDYDPASGNFRWTKDVARSVGAGVSAGSRDRNGYVRIQIRGERHLAHRLAWLVVTGELPSQQIDHIDGNRANNAFCNLRLATASENRANSNVSRTSKSRVKGVFCVAGRWIASIKRNGKNMYLGSFDTVDDARNAYTAAANSLFGEFARPA